MPLYRYVCGFCEKMVEKSRSVAQRHELTVCPSCAYEMELKPAAPGIAFKGGGWTSKGPGRTK
jgi:putative FmdB family regulatory protein